MNGRAPLKTENPVFKGFLHKPYEQGNDIVTNCEKRVRGL